MSLRGEPVSDIACPSGEELIAYQDGDLEATRLAEVRAHVRGCLVCRRRLRASEDIGRLFRSYLPAVDDALYDDPVGRAELKLRIRGLAVQRPAPAARWRRWQPALALALLVALALGVLWRSPVVESGSSFTRWWRDAGTSAGVRTAPTIVVAPDGAAAAPSLPDGLGLVGDVQQDADGFIRYYRNTAGLVIRVAEDRSGDAWLLPPEDAARGEIVGVDGRDVLVEYNPGHANVIAIWWNQGASLTVMQVLEQPPGGLRLDAALQIVRALLAGGG